jgi:hypothetical protein
MELVSWILNPSNFEGLIILLPEGQAGEFWEPSLGVADNKGICSLLLVLTG